jgi:zinc protease
MKIKIWLKLLPLLLLSFFALNRLLLSQERFRKTPPYPEPLAELKLPEVDSGSLSNGLALSVIHRESIPIINLRMIIFSGESSSPEKLPGVATLTARTLSLGASELSSYEIEEKIEFMGGNFSISVYDDYSVFDFAFLEEYLDEAIGLLSRMLLEPAFKKIEIDNLKRSMKYELLSRKSDPEFLARRQIHALLFKDHPYKKSIYNEDVIINIGPKDIIAFYEKYYRPNNSHIILVGNLNLPVASRVVSRHFSTWPRREVNHAFLQPPNPSDRKRICVVNLPRAKDVTIYIGNAFSMLGASEDIFPFIILNQVLGGTTTSRLIMNLRESKGYAYWAFSEVEFFRNFIVFLIKIKVRPEATYKCIEEVLNELKIITDGEIPSFDIEQAKSCLIGNFPLQIETLNNISTKVSESIIFNLKEELWSKYYENIMLVNSQKVFETARKYALLTPVVVIVGDQNNIVDYITPFEEIEFYDSRGILQQTIKKGEIK